MSERDCHECHECHAVARPSRRLCLSQRFNSSTFQRPLVTGSLPGISVGMMRAPRL
jgi:hypothetical protein